MGKKLWILYSCLRNQSKCHKKTLHKTHGRQGDSRHLQDTKCKWIHLWSYFKCSQLNFWDTKECLICEISFPSYYPRTKWNNKSIHHKANEIIHPMWIWEMLNEKIRDQVIASFKSSKLGKKTPIRTQPWPWKTSATQSSHGKHLSTL